MTRLIEHRKHTGLSIYILIVLALTPLIFGCGGSARPASDNGGNVTAKSDYPSEKIVLTTGDGVTIYGTFVYIDDSESHPAAILCHQFRNDRSSYRTFQDLLAGNGICSLAIDFRGFGESVDDGLTYTNFKDRDYIDMLNDIESAFNYFTDGPGKERVDAERIGLVGASIGANLAIMAGAGLDGLACIAALSPGRDYFGLKPIDYAPDVEIPAFVAYAKGDRQSAEIVTDLVKAFDDNKPVVIEMDGSKHGTDMLQGDFETDLLNWIKEQLNK